MERTIEKEVNAVIPTKAVLNAERNFRSCALQNYVLAERIIVVPLQ